MYSLRFHPTKQKMSSQKLWVQHQTTAKTYGPTKITIEECSDVDDFLKEIKKEIQLGIPQNTTITLYQPDGKTEIKPTATLKSLQGAGQNGDSPLIVKTTAVSKSSRQVTTRKMSVEASCRMYLDAIAKRLTVFYDFYYRFKSGATIGDVLEAKDGVEGED